MKNPWEKPKLIILVRGEPGERVLVACKTSGSTAEPNTYLSGCDQSLFGTPMIACDDCSSYAVS